ncbi:MAG: AsmA family protein [Elusimicrobiales bacterium]
MKFTRARAVAAALLLLAAGAAGLVWVKYQRFSSYIADQLGGQAAKKLGRQVKFARVSFSPLKGIVLRDACVSRRPDFSKGDFFCAEKVVILPSFSALIRNKTHFSRVAFDKPVIKVREKGGRWDFEDLLALLPETDKGLYLTWNADELVMNGATLEADMETSGLSLALKDADLRLAHYSSYGGNYNLEAEGLVQTVHNGKLVSAETELDADLNFDYAGLASTSGLFKATDLSYGAASLDSFQAVWKLFNIRKPLAERNYSVTVEAGGLLVPKLGSAASARVSDAMNLFSRITGKPLAAVEDYEADSFKASFSLDDSRLELKDLALRANFISLDASLAIDGPARTAQAGLKADLGKTSLDITASGPLDRPVIKPLLSSTLDAKLKEALLAAEKSLLKIFPVTGE